MSYASFVKKKIKTWLATPANEQVSRVTREVHARHLKDRNFQLSGISSCVFGFFLQFYRNSKFLANVTAFLHKRHYLWTCHTVIMHEKYLTNTTSRIQETLIRKFSTRLSNFAYSYNRGRT